MAFIYQVFLNILNLKLADQPTRRVKVIFCFIADILRYSYLSLFSFAISCFNFCNYLFIGVTFSMCSPNVPHIVLSCGGIYNGFCSQYTCKTYVCKPNLSHMVVGPMSPFYLCQCLKSIFVSAGISQLIMEETSN